MNNIVYMSVAFIGSLLQWLVSGSHQASSLHKAISCRDHVLGKYSINTNVSLLQIYSQVSKTNEK